MSDNNQPIPTNDPDKTGAAVDESLKTLPVGLDATGADKGVPADKPDLGAEGKPPEINWEEKFNEVEKNYGEARKKINDLGYDRNYNRQQFENLTTVVTDLQRKLSDATKAPLPNPEEFLKDVQTNGVKAFMPYIDEPIKAAKQEFEKTVSDLSAQNLKFQVKIARITRENDPEKYPGFKEAWPEIEKMAEDPNTPVNFDQDLEVVVDTLYNLYRSNHSKEAILEAEKKATETAESKLAKESKTTVAGGGTRGAGGAVTEAQLKSMTRDKLREVVAQMHSVADRD